MTDKKFIIHDIETFKYIFCVVFKFQNRYLTFEISSRKDESSSLRTFLKKAKDNNWFLVGFNNVRFDGQILHWIVNDGFDELQKLPLNEKSIKIHEFAQEVITKANMKQFPPYPEYKLSNLHIDLFLQNHYNNKARSTSLKWLEYSMNWKKVQDLPYKHDQELDESVFDSIIEYCKNDVDATDEFFWKCQDLLELRFSQQYSNPNLNLINKSDSSVGELLFLDLMSNKLDIEKNKLKKKQTHYSEIPLEKVILPYINFKTKTFNDVLEYFKKQILKPNSELDEERSFKHSVEYQGIDYVFGVGGLHASPKNKIMDVTKNTEYTLIDADVASYYPNLSIRNGFYPKHLSKQFVKLYEELYDLRKSIPKSNPQNKSLKLLLNSIYGKSGDIYSFVYDKFFQMCITVNGQLLLTMLAERLSFIDGVSVFYCNTDGLTIKCKNDIETKTKVHELCKKWEELTKLELEYAVYDKMFIRDVNNYIAVEKSGKVKLKGAFEIDVEYHKNRSQRIVAIAVKRYFVDGVSVEETIKNHLKSGDYDGIENQGIFDFCIGKKIQSNQNYSLEKKLNRTLPTHETKEEKREFLEINNWEEVEQNKWRPKFTETKFRGFTDAYRTLINEIYPEYQTIRKITDKVLRFYVSQEGQYLNKNYSDGRREVTVGGKKVNVFMDYEEKDDYQINYDYYINESYKIIHEVDGTNERVLEELKIRKEKERLEKEKERLRKQKLHEENMFLKYCLNEKGPTKKQYERYAKEWLLDKYGKIENIR